MGTFTYESQKYRLKNVTIDGNLDLLDDGAILKIGNDDDLQITHSGSAGTITNNPGDLTLDVAGDIILDADGADVILKDAGTEIGKFAFDSSNLKIASSVTDKDIIFQGNDGGSTITALTLDMSDAGTATFNHDIKIADGGQIGSASDADAITIASDGVVTFSQSVTLSGGISGDLAISNLDIDGGTDIGADLVDADLMIVDDGAGGTNRKAAMSRMKTYILESVYPVGSIFISTSSTDPATSLGFGSWSRFGEGKMLISQDSSNSRFDVAEETGGSESVTLTTSQIPSHTHTKDAWSMEQGIRHKDGTDAIPQRGDQGSQSGTFTTDATGGGQSHDNMPPYIVTYMWKRTS